MAKAAAGKKKVFRKKEKKNIPVGIAYIAASFNNTMISITDLEGNLISQSSSGARGFRGSRKGTPFAAQQAAYEAAKKATEILGHEVKFVPDCIGPERDAAVKALQPGEMICLENVRFHPDPRAYDSRSQTTGIPADTGNSGS